MQPTRHAYGALLLERGEIEPAAAVYAADLGFDSTLARACQHPSNVWSLHGYHESLLRLGRTGEAMRLKPQLDRALAGADVEIKSSCFCRLHHAHPLSNRSERELARVAPHAGHGRPSGGRCELSDTPCTRIRFVACWR
jgi:hypothetical protein